MGKRVHMWAVMPTSGGAATSVALDFTSRVNLSKRHRVVRCGWLPNAEPAAADVILGLFYLSTGGWTSESLVSSLYYPNERRDLLPAGWDGSITVNGGDGTNPWSPAGIVVVYVEIEQLGADEEAAEGLRCG